MSPTTTDSVRLALPKGRMQDAVQTLLADAGLAVRPGARSYRPELPLAGFETKLLKPQAVVHMLHAGTRDLGFAGADWVAELGAELVELVDTGLDRVRLVAAAPMGFVRDGALPRRPLVVASEYERLAKSWISRKGIDATFVRSWGATEVLPPEDADVVVDNTASGATLVANGLAIVDELLASSTRLYASPRALDDSAKRERIETFALLVRSVLEARERVMVEVNVTAERLESVCAALPCMREPTISRLHGEAGYAVRAAVRRSELPRVVPEIKRRGGTDVVVSALAQIVP
ncbi:MAG: ATP phosphoribosyltransferase [Planctomycetota bacterium]|nr:ATP phosphoribosyltransferase [Planctomycetota bacterium]